MSTGRKKSTADDEPMIVIQLVKDAQIDHEVPTKLTSRITDIVAPKINERPNELGKTLKDNEQRINQPTRTDYEQRHRPAGTRTGQLIATQQTIVCPCLRNDRKHRW